MLKTYISILILGFTGALSAQEISIDSSVSMLALGDSYTIGHSVSTGERWPHQFIDELRKLGLSAEYPDYIATTGWTTTRLIEAMKTTLNRDKEYNLVAILIGVNNQYQRMDISLYEPDLKEIIDRALEIVDQDTSRIFILSIPDYAYTPFGKGSASISKEIDDYNAIKKRVASQYHIAYVDITPISRQGLLRPELVAGDGLHPSGQQYKEWVEQLIPVVVSGLTLRASDSDTSPVGPLTVFPNPATFEIQVNSTQDIDRIRIFSSAGRLLKDLRVHSMPVIIDLSQLPPDTYILRAIPADQNRGIFIRKFILGTGGDEQKAMHIV